MASLPPPPPPPDCGCNSTSQSQNSHTSLPRLFRAAFTYDTTIMLAAIISLLLVILFILLLHLYARWYLAQVRRRSRSRVIVPRVLESRLHNRFAVDTSPNYSGNSIIKRGLPISAIASLPQFVYKKFSSVEDHDHGLDCAICLSAFEEEEVGRKLPGCGHAFHVECIDMWLYSHSTCPICRAAIQCNHSRKIDHLEIEITDPEQEAESDGLRIENDEQLPSESVTTTSDEITEEAAADAAENDCTVGGAPSSSIGESLKKFLTSSGSCSSRSGGKIHPSSNDNGDEPEAC